MLDRIFNKGYSALLVPYRRRQEDWEYFLQRRTVDAEYKPNCFGSFGGGIEAGETPIEALEREIREELSLVLAGHWFFSRYENATNVREVWALEVDSNFEKAVTVNEGQYGKFLTLQELLQPDIPKTENIAPIITELDEYIGQSLH